MPNLFLKGIVISVLVCSVFHFVHCRRFGDVKKRFLDIAVCAKNYEYNVLFRCFEINNFDLMCDIPKRHFGMVIKTYVQWHKHA